jgi:O-antigen/teichoic acid export membrane protein
MKGLTWSFISTFLMSVSGILYYSILTRFLSPDDFGVFSISLIILGCMDFFSGAGISAVLIQEKKVTALQLSTFFWINIGVGILLTLTTLFSAPFLAEYFKSPALIQVLYILSATVFLQAFSLIHNNLLRKELQMVKAEKIEMASTVVQIISGCYLAISGFALFSLPVSFLLSKIVSSFSYIFFGAKYFTPSFNFHYLSVKKQMSLGRYQVMEKIFNFLRANIDKFLIGKFLGTESLGFYTLAQKLIYFPLSKVNPALNKILYPYFSKLQLRPSVMVKLYENIVSFLIISITPLVLFVIVFAQEITSIVFDPRYGKVAILVQILSILGLLKSFSNIGGNVLNALGKFKVGFVWNFVWSLSLTIFILTGFLFNLNLTQITWLILIVNIFSFFAWHRVIYQYFVFPFKAMTQSFFMNGLLYFLFLGMIYVFHRYIDIPEFNFILLVLYFALLSCLIIYLLYIQTVKNKSFSFRAWK